MNDKEFAKALTATATLYNHPVTTEVIKIYFEVLKQFKVEDIKKALLKHIQTSKFFPKPSEIIEIIAPKKDLNLNAEIAWNSLLEGITSHGYYYSVQFDDPIIHSVIRSMGGWQKVSDREQDNWMHKDFIETYKILSKKDSHPESITGFIESKNGNHICGTLTDSLKLLPKTA